MTPVSMEPMVTDPSAGAPGANGQIRLTNPVREHFEAFIFGNALHCERVVEADSAKGQTIVICGAGPSLADHAAKWTAKGDQVWGCNSALTYLVQHEHRVTHGFTIDQTPHMLEEWYTAPAVDYLLASTVHPHLAEFLAARGRSLTWFHNYVGLEKPPVEFCATCSHNHEGGTCADATESGPCGCAVYDKVVMEYEDWLYLKLFPGTVRVGSGLNSVTRAIDTALYMGAERVVVLGADCCIRVRQPRPMEAMVGTAAHRRGLEEHTQMHADRGHALASGATAIVFEGKFDGRYWLTKPDLVVTAVWLELWRRHLGRKKLTLIGDTLPNALQGKDDAFLDRLPAMVDGDGQAIGLR